MEHFMDNSYGRSRREKREGRGLGVGGVVSFSLCVCVILLYMLAHHVPSVTVTLVTHILLQFNSELRELRLNDNKLWSLPDSLKMNTK